jgi:glutaredoxin/glutathione-dependent peroxiredoxin
MTISTGDRLPGAQLMQMGDNGPETVDLGALLGGRKVAILAVPGAFTPTCHSAHLPGFVRHRAALAEKGVAAVLCIAVNDPFVMAAWDRATGAGAGGVTMLADPEGTFTRAIGMAFDAPPAGLIGRSQRYAMLVEDGVVTRLNREESPGVCDISGAAAMLAAI